MGLEEIIAKTSVQIIVGASILLALLAGYSIHAKKLSAGLKKSLYITIVAVVFIPTFYMAFSTIYLNNISSSKGPVHWHADIEIWACGKEIDLLDPKGLSNKIGTPTLHEHNDKRIHLEGVVVHPTDASLGKFFRVIGGEITDNSLIVPTNNGQANLTNGTMCPTGEEGQTQVFVYQTTSDNYFTQKKLDHPADYLLSPESNVPAGDCIIVEFGSAKSRTDKLCRSYKVAQQIGKLKGEKYYGN